MPKKTIGASPKASQGSPIRYKSLMEHQFTRAREPVRPTSGKVSGYFPSTKNNRSVAWESQLEKKACYFFEFSELVKSFYEQPTKISYGFGRHYTPDFLLNLVSGQKVYVEIKPFEKLQDPDLIERFRFIEHYLNKANSSFVLITDLELNRPFIYENFNFLRPYCRQNVPSKTYEQIKRALLNKTDYTISDLLEQADSINQIYTLIANNYLTCDFTSNMNLSTKIKLITENSHATCHISFRTMPDLKLNRFHYIKDS